MRTDRLLVTLFTAGSIAAGTLFAFNACGNSTVTPVSATGSAVRVTGPSREAIGKYLIQVGGCNDCHTPGAMEGNLPPESQWLTGSPLGFKGPWGTTYAPNLRQKIQPYTEDLFIKTFKMRNTKPPMPWTALHAMSNEDLGALWAYIRSLGVGGQPAPDALPPGVEPTGPYITMAPPTIGTGRAATQPGAR